MGIFILLDRPFFPISFHSLAEAGADETSKRDRIIMYSVKPPPCVTVYTKPENNYGWLLVS